MDSYQAKQRIAELIEKLNYYNRRYYVDHVSEISDFEFDSLLEELRQLEALYPEYCQPDSPTQRIGSDLTKVFPVVQHRYPMLSLDNTYSEAELLDFDARLRRLLGLGQQDMLDYTCELKLDGVSISLLYDRQGKLLKAITRGNGVEGEDVTPNVRTITSLPLQLHMSAEDMQLAYLEVRGEVILSKKQFERLNAQRAADGEPLFANPRNTAAGTLKLQNPKEVARRRLECYVYALLSEPALVATQWEGLQQLEKWGLPVLQQAKYCPSIDEVLLFIQYWEKNRHSLPFEIDGVVIKLNRLDWQQQLGNTAKSPRWAIAYKYKPDQALTRLENVVFQVGRTGAVTPVALLQPIQLAGTVVQRASLHNEDYIRTLNLHIGDWVWVEKSGEIIPQITGVELAKRPADAKAIHFPENCPECGSRLQRNAGEAVRFCPNQWACPPQIKGRIEHFVQRRAMNIEGLGERIIALLYDQGLIRDVADLYNLRAEQLLVLEGFGERSTQKLLHAIEASKQVPFARVLYALGIRHVGETVAKTLARYFPSLDRLRQATQAELIKIPEIGEVIAESIVKFFADVRNQQLVERLLQAGLQLKTPQQEAGRLQAALNGLNIVVSGSFEHFSREAIKDFIEQNGGIVKSSVSSKTDYLVVGKEPGASKVAKAQELGVKIIDEQQLLNMVEKAKHTFSSNKTLLD